MKLQPVTRTTETLATAAPTSAKNPLPLPLDSLNSAAVKPESYCWSTTKTILKIVVGILIFPLGIYWLCQKKTEPTPSPAPQKPPFDFLNMHDAIHNKDMGKFKQELDRMTESSLEDFNADLLLLAHQHGTEQMVLDLLKSEKVPMTFEFKNIFWGGNNLTLRTEVVKMMNQPGSKHYRPSEFLPS